MRGGGVIALVGLTALIAYSVGRHDAPPDGLSPAVVTPAASAARPAAFVEAPLDIPAIKPQPAPSPLPPPATRPSRPTQAPPQLEDTKRKAEVVLTAAAIAAILIQASRDQYHATGRPCACPDDTMRNGRACGGRSAYSRPGGAVPLCYPRDVTAAMIETYRKTASR